MPSHSDLILVWKTMSCPWMLWSKVLSVTHLDIEDQALLCSTWTGSDPFWKSWGPPNASAWTFIDSMINSWLWVKAPTSGECGLCLKMPPIQAILVKKLHFLFIFWTGVPIFKKNRQTNLHLVLNLLSFNMSLFLKHTFFPDKSPNLEHRRSKKHLCSMLEVKQIEKRDNNSLEILYKSVMPNIIFSS